MIMNRLMAFGASRHYEFSIAERYYAKETTTKEFKFWGSCSLGIHNFFLAIRTSHHDLIRSCHFSHLLQNSWRVLEIWRDYWTICFWNFLTVQWKFGNVSLNVRCRSDQYWKWLKWLTGNVFTSFFSRAFFRKRLFDCALTNRKRKLTILRTNKSFSVKTSYSVLYNDDFVENRNIFRYLIFFRIWSYRYWLWQSSSQSLDEIRFLA